MKTTGSIIRELRKEKGISQEELAVHLGVTSQAVSKWENDNGLPDISLLVPIADYFDVSLDYLFMRVNAKSEDVEIHLSRIKGIDNIKCRINELIELSKRYPKDLNILSNIVCESLSLSVELNVENPLPIYISALDMADRYLSYCKDAGNITAMKINKIELLCLLERYDEAKALAMDFKAPIVSSHMYLADICSHTKEHTDEIKHRQESIAQIMTFFVDEIHKLGHTYTNIGEYEKAIDVFKILLSLPTVTHRTSRFHVPLQNTYSISGFYMAECYVKLKMYDKAVELLEKLYNEIEIQCECMSSYESVTTPLLSEIDLMPYQGDIKIKDIYFPFDNPEFRCLYVYPRFQALVDKYNKATLSNAGYEEAREAVRLYPDNYSHHLFLADEEYQLAYVENLNNGSPDRLDELTQDTLLHYETVIENAKDAELIKRAVMGKVLTLRFLERIEEADWSAEFEYPDDSITTADQVMELTDRGRTLKEYLRNEML